MKSNRGSRRIHELKLKRDESFDGDPVSEICEEPKRKSWFTKDLARANTGPANPLYKNDKKFRTRF